MSDTTAYTTNVSNAIDTILKSNLDVVSKPCLHTIVKLLDNIICKPYNDTFRTIKLTNKAIASKIGACKGGVPLLTSMGFQPQQQQPQLLVLPWPTPDAASQWIPTLQGVRRLIVRTLVQELQVDPNQLPPPPNSGVVAATTTTNHSHASDSSFNVYHSHKFDAQSAALGQASLIPSSEQYVSKTDTELAKLQTKKKRLERTVVDPCWVATRPGQSVPSATTNNNSNNSMSNTTTNDNSKSDAQLLASKLQRQRAKQQQNQGFTTSNMRTLAKLQQSAVYPYTRLSITLPDGCQLTANFSNHATIGQVKVSLLRHCVVGFEAIEERETTMDTAATQQHAWFDLYVTPPRQVLSDCNATLSDCQLLRAAKLFVSWKQQQGGSSKKMILRPELFAQSTTHTTKKTNTLPASYKLVNDDNDTDDNDTPKMTDKKKPPPAKVDEDALLRRMMGQKKGLGGGKPKASSSKHKQPPAWFK